MKYINFPYITGVFIIVLIGCIYLQGITGSFYYDDFRPLGNLSQVTDLNSAYNFVFSEVSGPLGRSISMITFLLNVNDWPNNIESFLAFNVFLHLINGLLIFTLSYLLTTLCFKSDARKNYYIALAATAFWSILPIHVSTSFIAIQRMAGLSAFFVFSGISIYLYGLHRQSKISSNLNENSNTGFYWQITGLCIFTLLAAFSKENGVLLPVFILVLEITLLRNIASISHRRKLRIFVTSLAFIFILCGLGYFSYSKGNILPGRDFTLVERLLTQPQVLVDYIKLAFLPITTSFNPFHDNYPIVKSTFESYKAFLSTLVIVLSFGIAVIFRKKWPLYTFAVLWFLSAHLIESSVISLELYFEHRNYVALFGPCFALTVFLFRTSLRYKVIATAFALIYACTLLLSLTITAQLWGNKKEAAETWFIQQPGSVRASEHLAFYYLQQGQLQKANSVFQMQTNTCPSCITSQAQAMLSSCLIGMEQETKGFYNNIYPLIQTSTKSTGIEKTIARTYLEIQNKKCNHLSIKDLAKLNNALLELPLSPYNRKLPFLQNLYVIALEEKNIEEAIRLLYLAWAEKKDVNIAKELVSLLLKEERIEDAQTFVFSELCKEERIGFSPPKNSKNYCKDLSEKLNIASVMLNQKTNQQ